MLYTFLYIPIKKFQGLQKFKTPLIKNKVLIPQNQERCKAFPPGKGDRPAPPTTKDKGLNCAPPREGVWVTDRGEGSLGEVGVQAERAWGRRKEPRGRQVT